MRPCHARKEKHATRRERKKGRSGAGKGQVTGVCEERERGIDGQVGKVRGSKVDKK